MHLGHELFEGGGSRNVETFEEHLTDVLQEERGKPGKMSGWTGNPVRVRRRPKVVKRVCFLFQERVRERGDARKEKRLAVSCGDKIDEDLYCGRTGTTPFDDDFYWGVLGRPWQRGDRGRCWSSVTHE